ncbi:MAG: dephospho-CoA kinase, partial [Sphingomonadales bacterium]|nr:dephospho-CoA kinase [Sphingomonadales bacterium]
INFPDATENNEINRAKLGAIVFNSAEKTKQLEALVHPHVREAQEKFLAKYKNKKAPLVAFDIPLLFETGAEQRLDKTLVISASKQTQQQRVLERGGMTKEKFAAILAMQMDDAEKQKRASFVISSENGIEPMQKEIESLIKQLTT